MDGATADMEKMALEEGADRKLLIAVDFGTTFSGVAWAQTRRVCTILPCLFCLLFCNLTFDLARCSNYHHPMAR